MAEKTDPPVGAFNLSETIKSGELFNTSQSTPFDLRLRSSTLSTSTPPRFQLSDNIQFIGYFDPTKVPPVRTTKVVVLSQDPGPDMFLPAGTPVNLVMAIKEDLPVVSFNNIEAVVTAKYPLVGTLIEDLGKNDAAAQAAKTVLDQKSQVSYENLPPQDKSAVNAFIKDRFNISPDVPAEKERAVKVFENLRFLNSF
jgi:hypothetical protein